MYIGVGSVVMQSWDGKPKACPPIELLLQAIYHQLSITSYLSQACYFTRGNPYSTPFVTIPRSSNAF